MTGIALIPSDSPHHLDHMVPLCETLQIPLVVDPIFLEAPLKKYYPQIMPTYIGEQTTLIHYLAQNSSLLFVTSAHYKVELAPLFELIYGKKMHFWYCSHGHSDKSLDGFNYQEFAFTYGEEMERRLKEAGILQKLCGFVRTGNYRLFFYQKHQHFYDALIEREIFSRFKKKQKTLLYAPTWDDLEASSSFDSSISEIIDTLPNHYNLIIKLHPWTFRTKKERLIKLQARHNIVLLSDGLPLFPLLNRTDIYLGDYSSIGYDFLYYNRPLFFLSPKGAKKKLEYSLHLRECGITIPERERIFPCIEKHLDDTSQIKKRRTALYKSTFGAHHFNNTLIKEIKKCLNAL